MLIKNQQRINEYDYKSMMKNFESESRHKKFLKQILSFYEDLLNNSKIDKEVYDILEKIDGVKDNQIFAENNRTIMTCPPRIEFREYTQNYEEYSNLEVIKNQLKLKTKDKVKEFQKELAKEVKKFLNNNILEHSQNEILNKLNLQQNFDLIFNGKVLNDDSYLIDYYVQKMQIIYFR